MQNCTDYTASLNTAPIVCWLIVCGVTVHLHGFVNVPLSCNVMHTNLENYHNHATKQRLSTEPSFEIHFYWTTWI